MSGEVSNEFHCNRRPWCMAICLIILRIGRCRSPQQNRDRALLAVTQLCWVKAPLTFIRLSEPISRGTVTGQRNSRTRLRASCPTSRTSEHSRAGARRCDVRMFGCLPLDGPHREGGLLAGLRTYLPLSRTTLTQQFFGSAPQLLQTSFSYYGPHPVSTGQVA